MTIANVLTIAGSDPSGGAGIQADMKAFSALGAYAMSVLTALTAQNTRAVTGVHAVPPDFIAQQIDAVFADIRVDAVKIGMIGTAAAADAVAACLQRHRPRFVVLDPVMVAKSGDRLLDADAVAVIKERLIPQATVITPNLPEAADLLSTAEPHNLGEMHHLLPGLRALGADTVLLKGGHLAGGESIDLFADGDAMHELRAPRVATANTHGTGCTLAAAIAALLPQHIAPLDAIRAAKDYLSRAIAASDRLQVGGGHGPVHHFHALWPDHSEAAQKGMRAPA